MKPAAGVTATRPTTAPTQAPMALGLRPRSQSNAIHPSIAAAEAVFVVAKASVAVASAAERRARVEAEPAEPQHAGAEQHERQVGWRCGSLSGWPRRRPSTIAPASAAKPADMCTTVPPAKSSTPQLAQEAVRVPRPVRQRRVDEQAEQHHEEQRTP